MALTRATANTVVDAVGADAECLHRIKSAFFLVPWGQAGATRNFGMAFLNSTSMLADDGWHWILQRDPDFARSWLGQYLLKKDLTVFDPSDASTEQYVCTGIATATADAICRARTASPAAFARVASVDTVSRSSPYEHTATRLQTPDGDYVFDWWKTLHPWCPMLYRHDDFMENRGGILHLHFGGFA
jgi:hypothetical protein